MYGQRYSDVRDMPSRHIPRRCRLADGVQALQLCLLGGKLHVRGLYSVHIADVRELQRGNLPTNQWRPNRMP